MALEQTVKELQAQNSKFQGTLLNIAQGQKDMMALISKKKKTWKPIDIVNTRRRFKGTAKPIQTANITSDEDDNQEKDDRSVRAEGGSNLYSCKISEDEDYSDEQYPPADDKYKQLEDRLKAMEI